MMDLTKLYETQKILRDRINYNEPDRLNKLILALLVELGECANEWRGFKFWSKNQEPRLEVKCHACDGTGYFYTGYDKEECMYCGCSGSEGKPLLEEYVDGLHFVLELGIELGITPIVCDLYIKTSDINEQFIEIFRIAAEIKAWKKKGDYYELIEWYVGLGEMLGFTWEEVEQAYYAKNQINHQRQEEGY